jgi:hypothetical protein
LSSENGGRCNELTHFNILGLIHPENTHSIPQRGTRAFCAVCAHSSGVPPLHQERPSFTGMFLEPAALTPVPSLTRPQVYRPPKIA